MLTLRTVIRPRQRNPFRQRQTHMFRRRRRHPHPKFIQLLGPQYTRLRAAPVRRQPNRLQIHRLTQRHTRTRPNARHMRRFRPTRAVGPDKLHRQTKIDRNLFHALQHRTLVLDRTQRERFAQLNRRRQRLRTPVHDRIVAPVPNRMHPIRQHSMRILSEPQLLRYDQAQVHRTAPMHRTRRRPPIRSDLLKIKLARRTRAQRRTDRTDRVKRRRQRYGVQTQRRFLTHHRREIRVRRSIMPQHDLPRTVIRIHPLRPMQITRPNRKARYRMRRVCHCCLLWD